MCADASQSKYKVRKCRQILSYYIVSSEKLRVNCIRSFYKRIGTSLEKKNGAVPLRL